ncbi:MAG: hypothetical protein ACRD4O_15680 [Bryobacteraceae bacterium]
MRRSDSRRLVLETEEPLSASAALSVEYNDVMFLGEVVSCAPNGDRGWEVEIQIEQILTGLQSLMALRAGLLAEGAPQAPQPFAHAPTAVRN